MEPSSLDAAGLSEALAELEDGYVFDPIALRGPAAALERRAHELGEDLLAARARLCLAHMWLRSGDVAQASRIISMVGRWAAAGGVHQLAARTHSLWATVYRHLGDAAGALDHALMAVDSLDETATPYAQVWHRTKLGDALGQAGSIAAARERYAQAARLAVELDQPRLHVGTLNNWAWSECAAGYSDEAARIVAGMRKAAATYGLELEPADLDTIAGIYIENGRFAEAEQTLVQCIAEHAHGEHEDADALAEYLLSLARTQRGLGAFERAQASLDASRALCVERQLSGVLVRIHEEQSELYAALGNLGEALTAHKAFFRAHNELQSQQREAQARTRQAMFETAEARREAARFQEQARRDALTGLHNRRYIDEHVPSMISENEALTVALVDIDHFKRVNDQFSHDVGDQVLVMVAQLLEAGLAAVAPGGLVARLGGEEFLIVIPGLAPSDAFTTLEAVRRTVGEHSWDSLPAGYRMTVSIGVSGIPEQDDRTLSALLSHADGRLYEAKKGGRDRVVGQVAVPLS